MSPGGPGRGTSTPRPALPERDRRILGALVRAYIERGEPVSSLWLAAYGGLGVSSATVRNVLASLEEAGYVRQPHTSAGRLPTDWAYRDYVDQLLEARRPTKPGPHVEARIRQNAVSPDDALDSASQELSRTSHHLGFALALSSPSTHLKHIEFVALDATRVLVVIVSGTGQVLHKPITLEKPFSSVELTEAANYLNAEFGGMPIGDIRAALAERMQEDRALFDTLLSCALELTVVSLDADKPGSLFVHGTSSLADSSPSEGAEGHLARLRLLLEMIEEKHRLVQLLNGYIDGPGLTIVIGGEHVSAELQGYSLVASSYDGGGHVGAIGVIGPTRMRYNRTIHAVDSIGQALARILSDSTFTGS
ncbi:MAG: heat-inducible transcriptional repressor HrcA [Vicinamibacterales bacterium]